MTPDLAGRTLVCVERRPTEPYANVVVIDHHNPGDPGVSGAAFLRGEIVHGLIDFYGMRARGMAGGYK